MEIIVIAAMAQNRAIGLAGKIPWHSPEDLQYFKETTMGHCLIMGRRTYQSIGRPLPGRRTVVVSRRENYRVEGGLVAPGLYEALELCRSAGEEKIFIAGGGQIYQEALPLADAIHLTVLDRESQGDTFFPELEPKDFTLLSTRRVEGAEPATLFIYRRRLCKQRGH